jgi:hypothetical protein
MSESLDMLKTEEGQLNTVFALFGSAAQHAQFFEEALGNFLLEFNKICDRSLTIEELESLAATLQKKTMGSLLTDFKKYVTINNELITENISEALVQRNFLMHQFFRDRRDKFGTAEDRAGLMSELLGIEHLLHGVTLVTNGLRVALCEALKPAAERREKQDDKVLFTVDVAIPD